MEKVMQSRRWVFTLNNYTPEEVTAINSFHDSNKCKFLIYQLEKGENGTPHVQGYVVFSGNQRLRAVRELVARGHWETARGDHASCVAYSSKNDTRISGPFTFGEHGKQGQRSDLECAAGLVRTDGLRGVAEQLPGLFIKFHRGLGAYQQIMQGGAHRVGLRTMAYIGKPGTGKTYRCFEEAAYRAEELYRPVVTESKIWFDGYQGEKCILLDDFTGKGVPISQLLQICDVYPMRVEVKGGTVWAMWETVFLTSNLYMREWWEGGVACVHMRALERRMTRVEYMDCVI